MVFWFYIYSVIRFLFIRSSQSQNRAGESQPNCCNIFSASTRSHVKDRIPNGPDEGKQVKEAFGSNLHYTGTDMEALCLYPECIAASMVVESARICGRVGFALGVTGYLGRAWWGFGAAWCYCMGACITGL